MHCPSEWQEKVSASVHWWCSHSYDRGCQIQKEIHLDPIPLFHKSDVAMMVIYFSWGLSLLVVELGIEVYPPSLQAGDHPHDDDFIPLLLPLWDHVCYSYFLPFYPLRPSTDR